MFLLLQFYYGDKKLHSWYTNWVSQSLNSQASQTLQSVSPIFLSKKLHSIGCNEVLNNPFYTDKEAPAKKGKTDSVARFRTTLGTGVPWPGTTVPTHGSCTTSGTETPSGWRCSLTFWTIWSTGSWCLRGAKGRWISDLVFFWVFLAPYSSKISHLETNHSAPPHLQQ